MTIIVALFMLILIYKTADLVRLKHSHDRLKQYWVELAAQPVPENAVVYVVLGDSVAAGDGSSSASNSYVGIVANDLEKTLARPVHIINLGVSGAKTDDLIRDQLPKFRALSLRKDAVITLEIGANNVGPGFNKIRFEQEFNQILDEMPPQTIVASVPYFGAGIRRSREPNVETANKIINLAIAAHKLKHADIFNQTKDHGSWHDYAADYFHPNDRGHRNWSKAFIKVLY